MAGEETSANPYNIFGKISAFAVHHKRASFVSAISFILLLLLTIGVTCYRNISRINAVHNYSRELGEAMILSTASADYIESNLSRNAQFLSAMTSEFVFLLETDLAEENGIPDCMEYTSELRNDAKNPPASLQYSGVYRRKIDFAHFAHKTIDGKLSKEQIRRLHILEHLKDAVTGAFMDRLPPEVANASPAEQNEYLRLKGIPLHLLLFGFPDGQYVVYPGSGYKDDYDPRGRPWYKSAQSSNGGLVWSKPYRGNTAAAGYLISCNGPMLDTKGDFLGVVGFDLSLNIIIENLNAHGNTGSKVLEKTLLDNSGLILLSTSARFENAMETNKEDTLTVRFDDEDLFAQFKELKYGAITREENGHSFIYCVNYLPSQNWYYFEKIDISAVSAPAN